MMDVHPGELCGCSDRWWALAVQAAGSNVKKEALALARACSYCTRRCHFQCEGGGQARVKHREKGLWLCARRRRPQDKRGHVWYSRLYALRTTTRQCASASTLFIYTQASTGSYKTLRHYDGDIHVLACCIGVHGSFVQLQLQLQQLAPERGEEAGIQHARANDLPDAIFQKLKFLFQFSFDIGRDILRGRQHKDARESQHEPSTTYLGL
jgi:hypothetical protein